VLLAASSISLTRRCLGRRLKVSASGYRHRCCGLTSHGTGNLTCDTHKVEKALDATSRCCSIEMVSILRTDDAIFWSCRPIVYRRLGQKMRATFGDRNSQKFLRHLVTPRQTTTASIANHQHRTAVAIKAILRTLENCNSFKAAGLQPLPHYHPDKIGLLLELPR
jgi:hypothetical protein